MTFKASLARFGTMAVRLGYITRDQLVEALAQQVDDDLGGRPHRAIGHILIDSGWMTPAQVESTLRSVEQFLASGV